MAKVGQHKKTNKQHWAFVQMICQKKVQKYFEHAN